MSTNALLSLSRRQPSASLRDIDKLAGRARQLHATSRKSSSASKRLYSSSSKPAFAPAAAAAVASPNQPSSQQAPSNPSDSASSHITRSLYSGVPGVSVANLLSRPASTTVLPTPLPDDRQSATNTFFFMNSPTQESLAVINACLYGCHDVPRARNIFNAIRSRTREDSILDINVYNALFRAYLEMASKEDARDSARWVEEMWQLYLDMENGIDHINPSSATYAHMLALVSRFGENSVNHIECPLALSPTELLRSILKADIPISSVVADLEFSGSTEVESILLALHRGAVSLGRLDAANEISSLLPAPDGESGVERPNPLEGVPEVTPVIKPNSSSNPGEGETPFNLQTLRACLEHLRTARSKFTNTVAEDAMLAQKMLEQSAYDAALETLKHESAKMEDLGLGSKALQGEHLQRWMWEWYGILSKKLKEDIGILKLEERCARSNDASPPLSAFLTLLKAEKLALIAILELMRLQGSGGIAEGMKTARALLSVGKAVEQEYEAEILRRRNVPLPTAEEETNASSATDAATGEKKSGLIALQARRLEARALENKHSTWTPEWTQTVRVKVGSYLVDALMEVALVTRKTQDPNTGEEYSEEQPAFVHQYEYIRGRKLGVIKLNPIVADRMAKDPLKETLHPRHLPMLVKPRPWLAHNDGGYLYNKTSVMRIKDSVEQLSYLRTASQKGTLEAVYAGLDVLASTPWTINRPIFDVMLSVWNSGVGLAKIPPAVPDAPEPVKPPEYETDARERAKYVHEMKHWVNLRRNNHSERCHTNYKLEIARSFIGHKIYFPHNLDFRGRAYAVPPHLNHIGDDVSRGLLKFGESKPLGESGLRWLKIHLANVYGYDKASFEEREIWVMERLEDIYDSATKPLEGKRWWLGADDPWQCLATCMELHAALESPNPLAFESSLPVHQDGTCNGLQHYAALGGDSTGAKQVNLDVTERPSDVYTYVADMVDKEIAKDCEKGERFALMIRGKISRKVVKQTVMTTVYGVTFVGARAQIEKQLKDRGDIALGDCWLAASYLAKKVLGCIGDLFKGAQDIQNFLSQSARLIAKSVPEERLEEAQAPYTKKVARGKPIPAAVPRISKEQMTSVIWTTPLGLPIVQPYRKSKKKQVMTGLQTVFISDPNLPTQVNPTKQASAFPPNFIHSLDATHMLLTALDCRDQGLTFASVHDSYWTHATNVDQMSAIIRETFIALHTSDVLAKLRKEFEERYAGYMVPLSSLNATELNRIIADGRVDLPPSVVRYAKREAVQRKEREVLMRAELSKRPEAEAEAEARLAELECDLDGEEDEVETPRRRTRASTQDSALEGETGPSRFLKLTDILPQLPKKGDFSVQTIKKSLYFFS